MIALEYPLPLLKSWAMYRSFVVRIVLLLFQVFLGILYYQVSAMAVHFDKLTVQNLGHELCALVIDSGRLLYPSGSRW